MYYPACIQKVSLSEFQLSFPDLPGITKKGESVAELMTTIEQTIAEHFSILAEYGEAIPNASTIDEAMATQHGIGIIWTLIDFDITPYLGKSHKINVTLPELLIKKIDDRVKKSEHYSSRSGFIAQACLASLNKSLK